MQLPTNTDAHILQLIKKLDKQSIPAILEQYGDSFYGLAYHKLQSEILAAEVIQQTFLTVWRQLPDFDEQHDSIFNWILHIMNSVIANKSYPKAA